MSVVGDRESLRDNDVIFDAITDVTVVNCLGRSVAVMTSAMMTMMMMMCLSVPSKRGRLFEVVDS